MGDMSILAAVAAGIAVGAGAAWLLLRQATARVRYEGELARGQAEEILAARDQQLQELREEQKVLAAETEKLRESLRHEAERRAAAEEKNTRIPALEKNLAERNAVLEEGQRQNAGSRARISELETRLANEMKNAEEKIALLNEAKERLKMEFQNIANKIFEDKSQKFTEQNRENMNGLLKPMREQLQDFKKKVEDVYDKESKERVSLYREVINLKTLNERISEDAVNLTNALKGQSQTRGAWGEVILERILEESGLQKGREYETQTTFTNEVGRHLRPDVIIHLPEGKDVVVDSKVSLTAYEKYCSAKSDENREKWLREHSQAVRLHVKSLSVKKYEELAEIKTLDFVLMFLPIEGAFWTAIEQDPRLFNEAFEKNIMLVGPSTLLATLRIIQSIWRHEDQNRNAQIIAKKAGDLYDKVEGFVGSLTDVGDKIGKAQEAYDRAYKQLKSGKGNLIRRTEELKTLGVSSKKSLPEQLVSEAMEEE